MRNKKLAFAVGLAAATLALVLTNVLGGPALLQSAGLAAAVVISAIALAAGAYALSSKHRSFPVAGLLALSGIILMIPAIIATGYFTVIVFPGPILGVIFGLVILGLGVAKGIGTARAKEMVVR
jgi:O-antigen/teichoic acid export membrane protein